MEFKDYYAILGVKPSDDLKAIKTAYRRLARKYHPDVSTESNAEAQFKEVAEAYEVLKDDERRAEYDQLVQHRNDPNYGRQTQHGNANNPEDFSDIFSSMFGERTRSQHRRQSRAMRGQDIEMEVAVFLEETLAEQTRTIRYSLPVYNAFGMVEQEIPKTLNVKIPVGVGDGERIRLKGQGAPGTDGGANGDLYLIIRIAPHPLFDIVGHNLEIVLPVAPWEAALGAKVPVPTLKDAILLTIPAGSQTGQRLRIKGKGLVGKKETGDLYAVIKVVMPPKPDEKNAALWQQLAEAQPAFDPRKEWSKQNG
ncbi:Curved DNA-binding protein [Serratia sp. AS12]|uniref:curved DNA-binding protein n=1 Tax=Serratia TaxID=613 RepID=UPI00020EA021|nr:MULTISPECIES: curved DNA-binding protein [Serratia]AEF47166.1 Curved DNA-binding protein [Serratia plymuthica AS9]AEF52118.1 Curved DNA-binding protein [Serratia sp. AS12]AEG29825.1 Curved DNA-binding protein [Serratia sp. AS13]UTN95851.1 curved DNA-binding protein [Serratia plymuthica]